MSNLPFSPFIVSAGLLTVFNLIWPVSHVSSRGSIISRQVSVFSTTVKGSLERLVLRFVSVKRNSRARISRRFVSIGCFFLPLSIHRRGTFNAKLRSAEIERSSSRIVVKWMLLFFCGKLDNVSVPLEIENKGINKIMGWKNDLQRQVEREILFPLSLQKPTARN